MRGFGFQKAQEGLDFRRAVQIDMGDQPKRGGPFGFGGDDLDQIRIAPEFPFRDEPNARTRQDSVYHCAIVSAPEDDTVT